MKVSIIIINFNSSHHTLACIESVTEQTKIADYEIIVVDNGSDPDDFDRIQPLTAVPRLKLVRSEKNLGFSGGHLFGLKAIDPSSGYYFFLNNDCLLLDDLCSRLWAFMEANPRVGICTGQMVRPSGGFDPSFTYFPTVTSKLFGHTIVRWLHPENYPKRQKIYVEPVRVPVIMGSALFVRAASFWEVGGFDDSYFLYCEEEDLCHKLRKYNWMAVLVPDVQFLHIGGGSTESSLLAEKEYYISLFHYFRKHLSKAERLMMRLLYTIKVGRRIRKDKAYGQLAWFILKGASRKESLRYRVTQ